MAKQGVLISISLRAVRGNSKKKKKKKIVTKSTTFQRVQRSLKGHSCDIKSLIDFS